MVRAEQSIRRGQIIERMIEAIRKNYWQAPEQTQRELVERWHELGAEAVRMAAPATRDFIERIGAGLAKSPRPGPSSQAEAAVSPTQISEQVRGAVMKPVEAMNANGRIDWRPWAGAALLLICFVAGALMQARGPMSTSKGV